MEGECLMNNKIDEIKILTDIIKSAVEEATALDGAMEKLKSVTNNDNIVRINGNNFTDYDKAIDYIEKLKNKEIAKWFFHDANLYGIGYAILKWCKANDKYYNENILKSAIDEYSVTPQMGGSNFANDVLRIYNKILELPRYRGLVFKGLER
jgi:hypothetical protein